MKKAAFIVFIAALFLHFNFFGFLPAQDLSLHFSESQEGNGNRDRMTEKSLSPRSPNTVPVGRPPGHSGAPEVNAEVAAVLRGAVEDKGWLFADSEENLRSALGAYFTGDLLEKLIRSARDFNKKQTDWQTTTSLEEYAIDFQGRDQALASVLIADTDPLNGQKQFYAMEYSLVKTCRGWRIDGMLRNSVY